MNPREGTERRAIRWSWIAAICAVWLLSEYIPGARGAEAAGSYMQDFQAFCREIDQGYPFFNLKRNRKDWLATKKKLAPRVKACRRDEEFLSIIVDAMKCLRDAHIGIRRTDVKLPSEPPRYYPGISFLPATKGRVVVMYPPEGSDPDVRTGTVVIGIDKRPARRFLENEAKEAWKRGGFFSSPQRARLFAYRRPLVGETKGQKHSMIILVGRRKKKKVELVSSVEARGWPHTYHMPENLTRVGRSASYTQRPSGVGYIYLRRVDKDTEQCITQAAGKHPDAKGWLIDLRGNGGGGYGRSLLEALQKMPRPVAVLIDAGCMSAGETLARDIVRATGARLFGSTTAGSSSAKKTWEFPSGIATLSLPVRSRWGLDRQPIEYRGIRPHDEVEAVPEELQSGKNSTIVRAEKYLLKQVAGPRR